MNFCFLDDICCLADFFTIFFSSLFKCVLESLKKSSGSETSFPLPLTTFDVLTVFEKLVLGEKYGLVFSKGFVCFENKNFGKNVGFETCGVEDRGFENELAFIFAENFAFLFANLSGLTELEFLDFQNRFLYFRFFWYLAFNCLFFAIFSSVG